MHLSNLMRKRELQISISNETHIILDSYSIIIKCCKDSILILLRDIYIITYLVYLTPSLEGNIRGTKIDVLNVIPYIWQFQSLKYLQ